LKVLQARSDLVKSQAEFMASRGNEDCQKKREGMFASLGVYLGC